MPAPNCRSGPGGPASVAVARIRFTAACPRTPSDTSSAATPDTCGAPARCPASSCTGRRSRWRARPRGARAGPSRRAPRARAPGRSSRRSCGCRACPRRPTHSTRPWPDGFSHSGRASFPAATTTTTPRSSARAIAASMSLSPPSAAERDLAAQAEVDHVAPWSRAQSMPAATRRSSPRRCRPARARAGSSRPAPRCPRRCRCRRPRR